MNDPVFMTVQEVVAACRAAGMKMSYARIQDMAACGAAPFLHLLRTGKTGRRTYIIYRVEFLKWLKEVTQQ